MEQKLLYRYIKINEAFLDKFLDGLISFTRYGIHYERGELSIDFDQSKLENEKYRTILKNNCLDPIINNINDNYYMCCLSQTDPQSNESTKMWNEYANEEGICVLYSMQELDLNRRIYLLNRKNAASTIDEVIYGNGPFDIFFFANAYFNCIGDYVTEKEIKKAAKKVAPLLYKIGKGHLITNMLSYKDCDKDDFPERDEIRMVMFVPNRKVTNYFYPFKQKPIGIVYNENISSEHLLKIKIYCLKNGIDLIKKINKIQ